MEFSSADDDNREERKAALDVAEADHRDALEAFTRAKDLADAMRDLPAEVTDEGVETAGDVRVGREALTYERGGPTSIFRDMYRSKYEQNAESAKRLARHGEEMMVEATAQQRAISTSDGAGGEFVPPVWLQDEWIGVPRAGRPIADSLRHVDLPPSTDTINLPKVTAGTATAVQTDGNAVNAQDLTTGSVTGAVQTIAGQQDVSQQLVDLSAPGIDVVIFDDITRDYDTQLDSKVINGTVTNAKGLLQLSSTNGVTFTNGSPTAPLLYPKVANGIGQVHNNRFLPPQVIAMTPLRWAWILASLDTSNRPLVVPVGQPGFNALAMQDRIASESLVGTLQGLPVIADASIPQTNGASTNEDAILIYRADDIYLYETPTPRLRVFEEVLSGTLQVRFQIYGYYALIAGRLPKAISKITGTGLAAPTF